MRLAFLTTALALCLVHPTAALAGGLSSLSLRLDAGTGSPAEIGGQSTLGLGSGTSLGASLALHLGPALRATAAVRHDRPSSAKELVTIPEIFLASGGADC